MKKSIKLCPCGSGKTVSQCLGKLSMRFAPLLLLVSCSQYSVKSAERDLCNARAAYVLVSDGKLDPEPDSPRAKLEAAEDEFCATLPR